MKIAVFCPQKLPHSSRIYMENITSELIKMGHTVIPFFGKELPTPVDIYWEPSTGRNGPNVLFRKAKGPVVVTFHGAANLALPIKECFNPQLKDQLNGYASKLATYFSWRFRYQFYSSIITVSDYAKQEAEKYLGISENLIVPIYHGIDHEIFHPVDIYSKNEPYLLHVSAYQPKKNLERIIASYLQVSNKQKPRLIIIAPGFTFPCNYEGIELIKKPMNHLQIAALYQNALGFIFPSLHETFGIPIIEAMACGCPVVTSNRTACLEVAGDAAVLVNPYSIDEITDAINLLLSDEKLRETLRNKGIQRAKMFTWRKSAEEHLVVFKHVLKTKND
jgi:glycosyltransferase involved in cell wall biosynthesis